MARYYFHLHDDLDSHDDEGREMSSIEIALDCAATEIRGVAAHGLMETGKLTLSHYIEIADKDGTILDKVLFAEALEIVG